MLDRFSACVGCWRRKIEVMFARVQKTSNGFVVEVPSHVAEDWQLTDGSAVELSRIVSPQEQTASTIRYASVEEVMEVHRKMEPRHAAAYRELAK
jgi:antitoxin component of MazEF toxin-antitoxin module